MSSTEGAAVVELAAFLRDNVFAMPEKVACLLLCVADPENSLLRMIYAMNREAHCATQGAYNVLYTVLLLFQTSSSIASLSQCRVTRTTANGIEVHLIPSNVNGFIPVTHLCDKASDCADMLKTIQPNQILPQAVILKMTPLILSIKPSYIEAATLQDIPTSFNEVHLEREAVATVMKVKNYGVFVEIANGVGGLLPKRLSGLEPEDEMQIGDSLLVKTEEVDEEKQRLLFRLVSRVGLVKVEPVETKVKAHPADKKPVVNAGKHVFGDIVSAKVLRVEKGRLRMRTTAKMIGYVRQAELSDTNNKKSSLESYHSGQILAVRIIAQHSVPLKTGKGRRVLTKNIKPKPPIYDFSIRHSVITAKSLDELRRIVATTLTDRKLKKDEEIKVEPDEEFQGVTDARSGQPSVSSKPKRSPKSSSAVSQATATLLPHLSLTGFSWDETEDITDTTQNQAESVAQDGQVQKRQKTGMLNERQIYERERQTNKTEEDDMNTADDFDQLVLSHGDDSMVWIRYMAFHLQHHEVDKARAVAQRAIKNISFRNETDRFNIWIALLNLENLHGTKESLDDTFHNAVQHNDPLKIYRQMAAILANTGKHEQAEAIYSKMTNRFKTAKEVWMDYGGYLMANEKHDAAHRLMQRSLQALDQRSQVDVIVKFALLELQHGSRERAKTMFESLLVNYPKRADLIHVYLSQMIKVKEPPASIRNLFEKIISMKMPAKKMKTFFKRYLEYEEEHGNAATVDHVKAEAKRFVEQNSE